MKFKTLFVAAFAALSLISVGCGGGGSNTNETITRTLLGGTGDSTTLTSKQWRMTFIRGNSTYVGTGADQPCPADIEKMGGGDSIGCGSNEALELRSDGKGRAVRDGVPADDFDTVWNLTGDTLSVVDRTEDVNSQAVITFKLTNEGLVSGHQRIRMTILSQTDEDGTTPISEVVGFQYVIEEV